MICRAQVAERSWLRGITAIWKVVQCRRISHLNSRHNGKFVLRTGEDHLQFSRQRPSFVSRRSRSRSRVGEHMWRTFWQRPYDSLHNTPEVEVLSDLLPMLVKDSDCGELARTLGACMAHERSSKIICHTTGIHHDRAPVWLRCIWTHIVYLRFCFFFISFPLLHNKPTI